MTTRGKSMALIEAPTRIGHQLGLGMRMPIIWAHLPGVMAIASPIGTTGGCSICFTLGLKERFI